MTDFDALFAAQPAAPAEPEIVDADGGQLALADAMRFITSGNAYFTLRSKRTGDRFTYRVARAEDKPTMFFVSVLTGPDNWANYTYLGMIFTDKAVPNYVYGKKSKIGPEAQSAVGFAWAFDRIRFANPHKDLEFFHAGKCGRCGRQLTVPESIRSGYGPECIEKVFGG